MSFFAARDFFRMLTKTNSVQGITLTISKSLDRIASSRALRPSISSLNFRKTSMSSSYSGSRRPSSPSPAGSRKVSAETGVTSPHGVRRTSVDPVSPRSHSSSDSGMMFAPLHQAALDAGEDGQSTDSGQSDNFANTGFSASPSSATSPTISPKTSGASKPKVMIRIMKSSELEKERERRDSDKDSDKDKEKEDNINNSGVHHVNSDDSNNFLSPILSVNNSGTSEEEEEDDLEMAGSGGLLIPVLLPNVGSFQLHLLLFFFSRDSFGVVDP